MIASYRTSVYLETATSGRTVTVTGRMTVRITVIAEKSTLIVPLTVSATIFEILMLKARKSLNFPTDPCLRPPIRGEPLRIC